MGARGFPAKPADQRRNRVKPAAPEVVVESAPATKVQKPEMPVGVWCDETKRWWTAWTDTPAAVLFSTTEWERLQRGLPVCEAYWTAVRSGDAKELRDAHATLLQAEKGLPATDYERRRAGLIVKPAVAPAVPVVAGGRRLKVV